MVASNGITLDCFYVDDEMHDPMQRFLMKETNGTCYLVPLPGLTIRQIDYAPSYNPEISAIAMPGTVLLLSEKFGFSDEEVAEEIAGISSVLTTYLEPLLDMYNVYSRLLVETSCDNVYTLRAIQYWQFLVDVMLDKDGAAADIQQGLFHLLTGIEANFEMCYRREVFCHPYKPIRPAQFFDRITVAAYLLELRRQNLAVWRKNGNESECWPIG